MSLPTSLNISGGASSPGMSPGMSPPAEPLYWFPEITGWFQECEALHLFTAVQLHHSVRSPYPVSLRVLKRR